MEARKPRAPRIVERFLTASVGLAKCGTDERRLGSFSLTLRSYLTVPTLGAVLFVLVISRRAWMCDDAFITVRAVDNLFHGHYFAYNADERVQAFTNPLWALMLVVPVGLFGAPFWGPVLTGIVVSGITVALLVGKVATNRTIGTLAILLLCFSRSFVDFSTSGLENPLTNLLLVLLSIELFRERVRLGILGFYASLAFVNRMDTLLLTLPIIFTVLWRSRNRQDVYRAVLGFVPAMIWLLFSIVYYGFPFPNSAYAKLNLSIPRTELVQQGLAYAFDALIHDPALVILIILGAFVGLATPRLRGRALSLVLAMLLYATYIVNVGGDFMSGRLWTPVLTLAMVLIVRFSDIWLDSSTKLWAASATAAVLALCSPFMPLRDDPSQETNKVPPSGVANERAWYQDLAAWKNVRVKAWHAQGFYLEGLRAAATKSRVHVFGYIGQFGMALGPDVHVIDDLALADALLARITFKPRSVWRIGHYKRDVPPGYVDSVKTGQNLIVDKCVHEYFEDLREITYGNIWSLKRWGAIWKLNQPKNLTVKYCPS